MERETARGVTDRGVGSGALLGRRHRSRISELTRAKHPPMLPASNAVEGIEGEAALSLFRGSRGWQPLTFVAETESTGTGRALPTTRTGVGERAQPVVRSTFAQRQR